MQHSTRRAGVPDGRRIISGALGVLSIFAHMYPVWLEGDALWLWILRLAYVLPLCVLLAFGWCTSHSLKPLRGPFAYARAMVVCLEWLGIPIRRLFLCGFCRLTPDLRDP